MTGDDIEMTTAGTCPICKIRPANSREHVWPHWFLKRMDAHAAPKGSWAVNGEPILDRDDVQYAGRAQRERVMLDICATCNNELDRRFEKPAKGLVDVLAINEWAGPLTQDEWLTIGLWWTKLLLLLGLPEARYATPRINEQIIVRHDEPQALDLRWLTDGSPPPSELSLYIHNVDLANQEIVHTIPISHRRGTRRRTGSLPPTATRQHGSLPDLAQSPWLARQASLRRRRDRLGTSPQPSADRIRHLSPALLRADGHPLGDLCSPSQAGPRPRLWPSSAATDAGCADPRSRRVCSP